MENINSTHKVKVILHYFDPEDIRRLQELGKKLATQNRKSRPWTRKVSDFLKIILTSFKELLMK